MSRRDVFTTIRTEGALLPVDLLQRILDGDKALGGLLPEEYNMAKGERINEAINRSWNRLTGIWPAFQQSMKRLAENDPGTGMTRDRWLLILFQELGYGRLPVARSLEVGGKSYPISHTWQNVPIHLVGCHVELDKRTAGVSGAARTNPHGLVQEFLNRSEKSLWGFVSNGLTLRLLRDSATLTRQSYVEFDLGSMFAGEVYSDFVLFWLLCHQSRVEAERMEDCWLEKWYRAARDEGTRALENLRIGVEKSIEALGTGFIAQPANRAIREVLQSGILTKQQYYRQLLRLVYRLIFLMVAEERQLLHPKDATPESVALYDSYYSVGRLRRLAEKRWGTQHTDLYAGLGIVMDMLGNDAGNDPLGLPALGSFLWAKETIGDLRNCQLSNRAMLEAIRALALTERRGIRQWVNYRNLGAEEFGSVYESLLELHPDLNVGAKTFSLQTAGGNERKTTGSYYTDSSLVNCLLDSALDPVLEAAGRQKNPAEAILALKICDPACGSGHFLIAAAHRIAKRLASIRTGDEEPGPDAVRHALRDVVGRCIYGVDLNEMAVELCKINLWMEAMEPGKPLSFLDSRILCGNSLLGVTPSLMDKGIPDEAFTPIEGDDSAFCTQVKKRNKQEREKPVGAQSLFDYAGNAVVFDVRKAAEEFTVYSTVEETIQDVHRKEISYNDFLKSEVYIRAKQCADAWCAAFVWNKTKNAKHCMTHGLWDELKRKPEKIDKWVLDEVQRLANQYCFFHWQLAFPEIFHVPQNEAPTNPLTGWSGGFDAVLGNPPWERVKLQEKEWFAERMPEIAKAPNAADRKRMIDGLKNEQPALFQAFKDDLRQAEGESHILRNSDRYPLCGRGDINTYAVFTELKRSLQSIQGRVGCIVPSGIATDDTTKIFFQEIIENSNLISLFDFENKMDYFGGVHKEQRFCLLTLMGERHLGDINFVFNAHQVDDLRDTERQIRLNSGDILLMNPNTRTCPVFRSRRDAELAKAIYKRIPVLIKEGSPEKNPWEIKLTTFFHMTNDSHLFRDKCDIEKMPSLSAEYLGLYEGKFTNLYNHRAGTFAGVDLKDVENGNERESSIDELSNPLYDVTPRSYIPIESALEKIQSNVRSKYWLTFHDICNVNNQRTFIATICPGAALSNSIPAIVEKDGGLLPASSAVFLVANMSSFIFDYIARMKIMSRHANFFIVKQLPVIQKEQYFNRELSKFMTERVLELSYTASELNLFASDLKWHGPPFRWNEERRFIIRCELDAAFFHLYGIERDDVDYIMNTFPIVRRREEAEYGSYRTKEKILEVYDRMKSTMDGGPDFVSELNPPPGPPDEWPPKGAWPSHIHNM